MKRVMSSRERILAAIDHKPVDCLPMDYWGTPEMTAKLMKSLGTVTEVDLWNRLDVDKIIGVWAKYIGPELKKMPGVS